MKVNPQRLKRRICTIFFILSQFFSATHAQVYWEQIFGRDDDLRSIMVDSQNTIFLGLRAPLRLAKSQNGELLWDTLYCNLTSGGITVGSLLEISNNRILLSNRDIWLSADNAQTWNLLFHQEDGANIGSFHKLKQSPLGSIYACGGWATGVWRSRDDGQNWEKVYETNTNMNARDIAFADDGTIYMPISVDFAWETGSGVLRSTDDGDSWENIFPVLGMFRSTAVNSSGDVFASDYYTGIYKYSGSGQDWELLLPCFGTEQLLAAEDGVLYAALDASDYQYGGVYASYDNGVSWVKISNGLYPSGALELAMGPDLRLYCLSTHFWYAYRTTQPVGQAEVAVEFSKGSGIRCYPNPATSKVNLAYKLPTAYTGQAFLIVLTDANGFRVWEGQGAVLSSGSGDFELTNPPIKQGVYVLSFQCGDLFYTTKLVVN